MLHGQPLSVKLPSFGAATNTIVCHKVFVYRNRWGCVITMLVTTQYLVSTDAWQRFAICLLRRHFH